MVTTEGRVSLEMTRSDVNLMSNVLLSARAYNPGWVIVLLQYVLTSEFSKINMVVRTQRELFLTLS